MTAVTIALIWLTSNIVHCVLIGVIIKHTQLIREIENGTRVFAEYTEEAKEKHRCWLLNILDI